MRVWIGNLGKYNEGELVGRWVTLPVPQNVLNDILRNDVGLQLTQQEVDEALRTTGRCYEEYYIADYECPELPHFEISEYDNINDVNMLATFISKCDNLEAVDAYIDDQNIHDIDDVCNVLAQSDDLHYITTSYDSNLNDNELLGWYYIDSVYGDADELYKQSPETFERYIDYEAVGRDYSINGNYERMNDLVFYDGEHLSEYAFGMALVEEYGIDNLIDAQTYRPAFYFDYEKFGRDELTNDYVVVSNTYRHQAILDVSETIDCSYYDKEELYELVEDDINKYEDAMVNNKQKIEQIEQEPDICD